MTRKLPPARAHADDRRLPRHFEGPEILAELLEASGCDLTVDDVVEEFQCAVEEGTAAHEVIPLLWELEPKFRSPDAARRTFSNLFGLWDEVAADARGELISLEGLDPDAPLKPEHVDRAWFELDELDRPAWRKARDRFDNLQFDLHSFVFEHLAGLTDVAIETALDLTFETWWICERLRGADRVPRPSRAALDAACELDVEAEAEPEPGLAAIHTARLWEQAADETRPLPEEAIAPIERVLRAVRTVLAPKRAR
ncbi:MAG: hypothetical protein KC620_04845 [Myxococcales bacterium]|nr:hypothetical protein [Myxococcales bacterium]